MTQTINWKRDKLFLAMVSFLFVSYSYSQDSTWKRINVDENLTINLPGEVTKTDTFLVKNNKEMRFLIFRTETKFSALGVTVTPNGTHINVDNEESLRTALNGIAKGTCESAVERGFLCQATDTTVDQIPCKKIKLYTGKPGSTPPIYNYTFLVNDKMYMFSTSPFDYPLSTVNSTREANELLDNIRFTKNIKERKFTSKAEALGYKVGYYFIPALLVIGVIIYVARKIG